MQNGTLDLCDLCAHDLRDLSVISLAKSYRSGICNCDQKCHICSIYLTQHAVAKKNDYKAFSRVS